MERRINTLDLVAHLDEVLNEIAESRESVVIERDGVPVATIRPFEQVGITGKELAERLADLRFPEGFADDLEAIHSSQGFTRVPEWPE